MQDVLKEKCYTVDDWMSWDENEYVTYGTAPVTVLEGCVINLVDVFAED